MTPEEQTELDSVKQQLRLTEKLLADEKGRVKAMELNVHETKRNAKIATEQAEALKTETENVLATGAVQMQIAHAIGCGIFGMAELARTHIARKVAAARVCHREEFLWATMQALADAVTKKDAAAIQSAMEKVKQTIQIGKNDGEANRLRAFETAIAIGFTEFEKVFDQLCEKGNV